MARCRQRLLSVDFSGVNRSAFGALVGWHCMPAHELGLSEGDHWRQESGKKN